MRIIVLLSLFLAICPMSWAGPFDPPVGIQDEGGAERKPVYRINCVGAGISCTQSGIIGTLTVAGGAGLPTVDTTSVVEGSADATKEIRFEVDGLTTATVRVITPPDKDFTMAATNDTLAVFAATTSAQLAGVISNETGSGLLAFGTSPTIATPALTGAYDLNDVAVDDDDCTGQQGQGWYDSTDAAWEFCNANSGAPATLAAAAGDVTAVGPGCATGACFTDTVATTGANLLVWEGVTSDASEFTVAVPSDPTIDITATFGTQTGTVALSHTKNLTEVGTGAATVETDLQTATIAANSMGTTGCIRITGVWSLTGTAAGKDAWLYFGTFSITDAQTAANTRDWVMTMLVCNDGSATAQKVSVTQIQQGGTNSMGASTAYQTAAIDTTLAVTVKTTGKTANAADEVQSEMLIVEAWP